MRAWLKIRVLNLLLLKMKVFSGVQCAETMQQKEVYKLSQ